MQGHHPQLPPGLVHPLVGEGRGAAAAPPGIHRAEQQERSWHRQRRPHYAAEDVELKAAEQRVPYRGQQPREGRIRLKQQHARRRRHRYRDEKPQRHPLRPFPGGHPAEQPAEGAGRRPERGKRHHQEGPRLIRRPVAADQTLAVVHGGAVRPEGEQQQQKHRRAEGGEAGPEQGKHRTEPQQQEYPRPVGAAEGAALAPQTTLYFLILEWTIEPMRE